MMHTRRHTHMHSPSVMGYSKSKEQKKKEKSSRVERKEAWEAMLTRGLGLSQLKRLDTGYIASIYSTNYATALRQAPRHTKIDTDDLLLPHVLPGTEGSASDIFSKMARERARVQRRSLSEMTFIKKASTGEKVGGDTESNVKAINSPEPTKDFDGKGVFPKMGSPSKLHPEAASLMDPLITSCQAKALHSACMLRRAVSFPRAKYFAFSDDTEDVDALLNASKSSDSALKENVCLVRDSADELVEPNLQPFLHTMQHGVPAESTQVNTNGHIFGKSESAVPLWDATDDGVVHLCRSSGNTSNLQKTLCMKYILNDNSIENEETQSFFENNVCSELSMLHGRLRDEDDDEVNFSYKSSSSSPASLKDWLPPEDPPLMLAVDFYQAGKGTSIFDAFQASRTLLGPGILPSTKRVLLKYVGADSSYPPDDTTQDILQPPERGGVATSLLVGTLENATEEPGACRTVKGNLGELYNIAELGLYSTTLE